MQKTSLMYIGIDPGTTTGIAVWNSKEKIFESIEGVLIHNAMQKVENLNDSNFLTRILVIFEDARLRKWFGNAGREKLMGAGSIRRDSTIWFDFLTDKQIPFRAIAPKNVLTKLDKTKFAQITGYKGITNQHGRDAGMIVFGI